MAANSAAKDGIGPKFELFKTFMDVLVTCKNEGDRIKIEGARVLTTFLPSKVYNSKIFNILLPRILDSFLEGSQLVRVPRIQSNFLASGGKI